MKQGEDRVQHVIKTWRYLAKHSPQQATENAQGVEIRGDGPALKQWKKLKDDATI